MNKYFELRDGALIWDVKPGQAHCDDLEMSGRGADVTISYGVEADGSLAYFTRACIVPTLRRIPNDTHASLNFGVDSNASPVFTLCGAKPDEAAVRFIIDRGTLTTVSRDRTSGARIERLFYPAATLRCFCERVTVTADGDTDFALDAPVCAVFRYERGTKGVYPIEIQHTAPREKHIAAGDKLTFYFYYTARIANEPVFTPVGSAELEARYARVAELCDTAVLESGCAELDTMFRLCKLRAGESIFDTAGGVLHSPGGSSYFAATWCNDQVEYAGPWFSQVGYPLGVEASVNAYKQYIPFMSDSYTKIPCSVIAEGRDIWEGAGDRGDAAMYLYGCSLFLLTLADEKVTDELWGAVKWCAEYCRRRTLESGVIRSDNDELEGRFPHDGMANLSTSSLTYGGLRLAAIIARRRGETALAADYEKRADALADAIESYFGATLHGYDTYRYSAGYNSLRAWICLPMCMGIDRRDGGTVEALLSDYLWTENGLLTCELGEDSKKSTIWDRSTLYGFRGLFQSGNGERVWPYFTEYCRNRLFGERVPYAVEAYPEGSMRHLSGESALFCRIITEGLLGIKPTDAGFSFTPRLPGSLGHMTLTGLRIFGHILDFRVTPDGAILLCDGREAARGAVGETINVSL